MAVLLSLSVSAQDGAVWVKGVEPPAADAWETDGIVSYTMWQEGCGWYDCNKKTPQTGGNEIDSRMCRAAVASNMLHWWLNINSEHISRYGKFEKTSNTAYPAKAIYSNFSETASPMPEETQAGEPTGSCKKAEICTESRRWAISPMYSAVTNRQ